MSTSITKEGIQLVKQEVAEVTLLDTHDLSLNNEDTSEEQSPSQASTINITVGTSPAPLDNVISEHYDKQDTLTESPTDNSADINNKKVEEPTNSRKEEGKRLEQMEYDDDDIEEGEGNLMIDDKLEETAVLNSITSTDVNRTEKGSQNDENERTKTNGTNETDVIIIPSSDDANDIEDDQCGEDSSEKGDKEVSLEKLPRPVNELNCRQSRTYLVKLLRAANGGLNPHYGNPEMKPAFWPDYYWPWAKLTDVHTKPRGMNEPLQYSEMMKLAIARGYQYFGYDPDTYFDPSVEKTPTTGIADANSGLSNVRKVVRSEDDSTVEEFSDGKIMVGKTISLISINDGTTPPKLPRPLSLVNCIQARTVLARLLRFQQGGNNPMYGSPETEPPWWPNNLIRWVDMVDLRGKPPYLPDNYTYTEVLKEAIGKCLRYNNLDPETHVDPELLNQPGMQRRQVNSAFHNTSTSSVITNKSVGTTILHSPQTIVAPPGLTLQNASISAVVTQSIPALSTMQSPITIPQMTRFVPIAPAPSGNISSQQIASSPIQIQIQPSFTSQTSQATNAILKGATVLGHPQRITLNTEPIIAQTAGKDGRQMVVGRREQIMLLQPSTISAAGGLVCTAQGIDDIAAEIQVEDEMNEDDDDETENLPPRLPLPIGRLNCSTTRTVLAKLIRFHCGNQLPNYGNPASMPCWWPNHLIDWTQIKNLSHKYEGYLGNTYSNCLRIAVIRGYAHYGLDANEYVEKGNNSTSNGNNFNISNINQARSLMDRKKNQTSLPHSEEEIVIEPAFYGNEDSMDSSVVQSDEDGVIRVDGVAVTAPVSVQSPTGGFHTVAGLDPRLPTEPLPPAVANCRQIAATASRPMGALGAAASTSVQSATAMQPTSEITIIKQTLKNKPNFEHRPPLVKTTYVNIKGNHLRSIVKSVDSKYANFPTKLLSKKNWFPPKLNCQRAICQPGVAKSLKGCKIILEQMSTLKSSSNPLYFKNISHKEQDGDDGIGVQKFIYDDMLIHHKFTDFYVQAGIGNKERIPVHRIMLITHSSKLKALLEDVPVETDSSLVFCGVDYDTLKHIVDAIYLGQVIVSGKGYLKKLEDALGTINPYGILCDLKRKPRTFPAWKISDANLTFADVSSSTNDPSDDENIENDEDDEDFILEDAHLLDYDSDEDDVIETNNSLIPPKERAITDSYIDEVRKQVFAKCAKSVPDEKETSNEFEKQQNISTSSAAIDVLSDHSADMHNKEISPKISKSKNDGSLKEGTASNSFDEESDNVSKMEVSTQSNRPTSARIMAKKLAIVDIADDIASESPSNVKKTSSKPGVELKITVEDSSIDEYSIPMIDDRIKTRRGGVRIVEGSANKTNTKENSPEKKTLGSCVSSNGITNQNGDEELGRGKRMLRKKQLNDEECSKTPSPKSKNEQTHSPGTRTLHSSKNTAAENKLDVKTSASSNLDPQKSPNVSLPHKYNSRSKTFITEAKIHEDTDEATAQKILKKHSDNSLTDTKGKSKVNTSTTPSQIERRTRGSIRKQVEEIENISKTETNSNKPEVGKSIDKLQVHSAKKDATRVQLEKTKEFHGKKGNEKWSLVSTKSELPVPPIESSSRSPRKRSAMPEPNILPSSIPASTSASSSSKRFKLLNAPQSAEKLKKANKPNFEEVNESLLNEKLQEGQISFVKFLMNLGFLLQEPPICNKCSSSNSAPMQLVKYTPDECNVAPGSNKIQATDGVAWVCPSCNVATSVRPGSIFARCSSSPGLPSSRGASDTTESLCWIMRLVLCWKDNTSLLSCQQATGADVDKIFLWYNICKEYYGVSGS